MAGVERVLVLFWDGMRPDHVRPGLTPNLWELCSEGAWYREAVGVFPTYTHPNMASLGTGAYPGKHGIHTNELMGFPSDRRPIMTNVRADLERLRAVNGGRVMPIETLTEALVAAGKKVVTLGSGPHGHGTVFDPELEATSIHTMWTWPEGLRAEVYERFSEPVQKAVSDPATDEWIAEVLLGYVLPELEPDVVFAYFNEPDTTQHAKGLGSPEALGMIQANDERLGRILSAVEGDGVPTSVIVVSDHGHSTISEFVDMRSALERGGFADEIASGRLFYGDFNNDVTVEAGPGAEGLKRRLAEWFAERSEVDAVIARETDGFESSLLKGIPASKLWNDAPDTDSPTAATFWLGFGWTSKQNAHGVPGQAITRVHTRAGFKRRPGPVKGLSHELVSMHGSLSPFDLNITLVLGGAGVRGAGQLSLPAGIVDVAPTVLTLLDLPPLPEADGRALTEAFENGPDPAEVTVRREPIADLGSGPLNRRWVGGTAYLDPFASSADSGEDREAIPIEAPGG